MNPEQVEKLERLTVDLKFKRATLQKSLNTKLKLLKTKTSYSDSKEEQLKKLRSLYERNILKIVLPKNKDFYKLYLAVKYAVDDKDFPKIILIMYTIFRSKISYFLILLLIVSSIDLQKGLLIILIYSISTIVSVFVWNHFTFIASFLNIIVFLSIIFISATTTVLSLIPLIVFQAINIELSEIGPKKLITLLLSKLDLFEEFWSMNQVGIKLPSGETITAPARWEDWLPKEND